ncbi:hypothetical protein [Candidatus Fokinia solitaria]|uniref:hypothetical protein n=1 Tax=Candidatus Fokinia solitaria TaxID=1802984 RepID=UPI0011AB7E17|nr:hypothetical protein [Candidatus Fokinia solitaria]
MLCFFLYSPGLIPFFLFDQLLPNTLIKELLYPLRHESSGTLILFSLLPLVLGVFVFKQRPVVVRHKDSGIRKTAQLGWCWTYFYFSFWVPLIRGEKLSIVLLYFISGFFAPNFILSFIYNKQHITRLLTSGWVLDDTPETEEFARSRLNMR